MNGATDVALIRRLLRQARGYWPHIVVLFALDLLSTPLALLSPIPLKIVVDSYLADLALPSFLQPFVPIETAHANVGVLLFAGGFVIAIAVLNQVQQIASSLLRTYTNEKLVLRFRSQLFQQAQRLSLSYHDSVGTSDSIYRVQWDAPAIQYISIDGIMPFVTACFTFATVMFVVLKLDSQLALIALVIAPPVALATQVSRHRLRHRYGDLKRLETSSLSVIREVLDAIRVVKAFGQEEREGRRFAKRSGETVRARLSLTLFEAAFGIFITLATTLGTAAVLWLGMRHVRSGVLSLGEFLLVMTYLAQLYAPMTLIMRKIASQQGHLASAERAFALLDAPPDVPEMPDALSLQRASGAVAFENVSFAYEDRPILADVSFSVAPGTCVGIAGATGAGKTTLMSLLSRFYDPREGRILLDAIDLRRYKLSDLRNQFAMVLQDPLLFSTSISENIAYSRPDASMDEIIAAAAAAKAHDFISNLPDGYDSHVGERGLRLSGGERQRISLARAFLKDAPILILDEPTSSIDIRTESEIMEAMERLMTGRTTFMIAHRVSTLANCDVVLKVENGRLLPAGGDERQSKNLLPVGAK